MEEKIVQIIERLENVAPSAWDAMLAHARLDAALGLAFSVVVYATIAVLMRRRVKLWDAACEHDLEPLVIIGSIVLGILSIIATVIVFSASSWLGLFYPEAAVIHKILSAATN